nr:MFS transporter [Pseudomonas sp. BF-R-19]
MTPYLQKLMNYPVLTAGIVMGPRGLGTMLCMFLAGRSIGRVDTRWLLLMGLLLSALSMELMTGWTPDVSMKAIIYTGFMHGASLGFLFEPLSAMAFTTLPAALRGDGTGLYNLSRNIGSSVGISICTVLLAQNIQINHADIVGYVTIFNHAFRAVAVQSELNPLMAGGRAALDALIIEQASWIAYMNDFRLLMILSLGATPLILLLRKPAIRTETKVISEKA